MAAILLIALALHVRMNRPIDRLVRQSEALAAGRLDDPFSWDRHDELGRLGHSLENTRQALAHPVGELKTVDQKLRTENTQRKAAKEKIALHAEVLEVRVAVEVTVSGNQAVMVVTNNGTGIPAELHTRIFEPMFTAHLGRGGVGLGLSVTQNMVVRHLGGKIGVQNALPSGACFVIQLPLVAPSDIA